MRLEMIERNEVLSISRQCALLSISRSSVYYESRGESTENLALMRRMDALSLQYPFYGSRQMLRHLRREGVAVGRRRVRRLMRVMGLEAIYRKPRTSVAEPDHRIYPYLLRGLTIDRPNQVWCSDITYIPVSSGFLYLVAIMDWASRHVLAWRLSNTMEAASAWTRWRRHCRWARRKSSIRIRGHSLRARRSPSGLSRRARGARWTAAGGAWTTSSSSGCGGR